MGSLTKSEERAIVGLAGIFSLRMLGLFMILPVFAWYASHLREVTPFRVGLALGIYGLTQALFQIPFGVLSDRIGRKPMIIVGLFLFSVGSLWAALSDSILGVVIGRALQGAGAVGGVLMALMSDLTREEVRTRGMAGIGMTIGFSFALAMVLGPAFETWIGVKGIFWLSACLGLVGIGVLLSYVPVPSVSTASSKTLQNINNTFKNLLKNRDFVNASLGVLILHATLTALFLKMPHQHWFFYLSILMFALGATVLLIVYSEKNKNPVRTYRLLRIQILILILAECILFYCIAWPPESGAWIAWAVGAVLFFTAFNFLEASLPAMVSKCVAASTRGTALGIFSSAQFLGLFLGGLIAGWLDSMYGVVTVFGFCVILAVVWLKLIECNSHI